MNPPSFEEFVRRVRSGDPEAAAELVRKYEPAIRRAVRVHLEAAGLRRLLDSQDICQSVLGSFFFRTALGQYDLARPEQLLGLLTAIARNKLIDHARRHAHERYDHAHRTITPSDEAQPDTSFSPSQVATFNELFQKFRERLTPEERYLAEQRAAGRQWSELAAETGGEPEAMRKQLARAIERVAQTLGVEV
jgi:RNA polymerase sigma-70 factor (ECF subfamily)